jgi:hypothetical protein
MHQGRDIGMDPVPDPEHPQPRVSADDESAEDADEDAQDTGLTLEADPFVDGTMLERYPPSKGCRFGLVLDATMLDGLDLISQKCDVCSHVIRVTAKRHPIKRVVESLRFRELDVGRFRRSLACAWGSFCGSPTGFGQGADPGDDVEEVLVGVVESPAFGGHGGSAHRWFASGLDHLEQLGVGAGEDKGACGQAGAESLDALGGQAVALGAGGCEQLLSTVCVRGRGIGDRFGGFA